MTTEKTKKTPSNLHATVVKYKNEICKVLLVLLVFHDLVIKFLGTKSKRCTTSTRIYCVYINRIYCNLMVSTEASW